MDVSCRGGCGKTLIRRRFRPYERKPQENCIHFEWRGDEHLQTRLNKMRGEKVVRRERDDRQLWAGNGPPVRVRGPLPPTATGFRTYSMEEIQLAVEHAEMTKRQGKIIVTPKPVIEMNPAN